MTYRELYHHVAEQLKQAGCDSPAFDAGCLFEKFADISRGMLPLKGGAAVVPDVREKIEAAARQRADGRPLQYILGEWDFLSLTLEVGEGVLIPRADTELLCETAAERLENRPAPKVLDLCAGSGCVGLGVASLIQNATVTAVELSDRAMEYLRRNCARYPKFNVTPVQADVLREAERFNDQYDAILSNPPYIPEEELSLLMREVQREPSMALDGGGDGLVFYRAIVRDWVQKLKPGGFCAVEVGIGQTADVADLFSKAGLRRVRIFKDMGHVERVVTGEK